MTLLSHHRASSFILTAAGYECIALSVFLRAITVVILWAVIRSS